LLGCSFAIDATAQLPGEASPPPIVSMSTLPRLRPAWTLSGVETEQWRYQEGVPAFDGTLIGWNTGGPDKWLVAIDVATGKERWRSAEPYNAPVYVEFAKGLVLVNGFGGATTALARDTGRTVWTAKLCGFYDHVRDDGRIGYVRCKGRDRDVTSSPGPTRYLVGPAFLIAFDLANGRLLWRRDAGANTSTSSGKANFAGSIPPPAKSCGPFACPSRRGTGRCWTSSREAGTWRCWRVEEAAASGQQGRSRSGCPMGRAYGRDQLSRRPRKLTA
jgi:hypothetical protein